jgi:hypothetical protein
MPKKAIAILTRIPEQESLFFYSQFRDYGFDVFCFIDDNSYEGAQSWQVRCVQISNKECISSGFSNFAPPYKCGAWDKAVYYFSKLNQAYDYVWFLEDDVFVPRVDTLIAIDKRYDYADIISAPTTVNVTGHADGWPWWKHVPGMLPPPWLRSMVCAVRLSSAVLKAVACFIAVNGAQLARTNSITMISNRRLIWLSRRRLAKLFGYDLHKRHLQYPFIEFIFHTLAMHDHKCIVGAEELMTIVWRAAWRPRDMRSEWIYHPVKELAAHQSYRRQIEERSKFVSSD